MTEKTMEHITSRQNKLWQYIRRVQTSRSFRYENRIFVAEGTKLYEEAVRWGALLDTVIFQEGLSVPIPDGVRAVEVPRDLLCAVSAQESPQGVLFLCRMPEPKPLFVRPACMILDGIQDPGNLGTILRTADALDVDVILSDGCADPYSDKTVRASMGAVFRVPPVSARKEEILKACERCGIPIAVTAMSENTENIRNADLRKAAVVIGSEGRGVCAEYMEAAQKRLMIPMNPHCESINAAAAAAIVMWQIFCSKN